MSHSDTLCPVYFKRVPVEQRPVGSICDGCVGVGDRALCLALPDCYGADEGGKTRHFIFKVTDERRCD